MFWYILRNQHNLFISCLEIHFVHVFLSIVSEVQTVEVQRNDRHCEILKIWEIERYLDQMLQEHKLQLSVSTTFSSPPKLSSVFLQLASYKEKMFSFFRKHRGKKKGKTLIHNFGILKCKFSLPMPSSRQQLLLHAVLSFHLNVMRKHKLYVRKNLFIK